MPFYFENIEGRSEEQPDVLLREFLSQVEQLLNNIIYGEVEGFSFRREIGEDLPFFEMVLAESRENGYFARASEQIAGADLQGAGLRGRSLHAKLGFLVSLSDQLRRGIRKAIKYILEMVNALLGSIQTAMGPAGIVIDAIAEIKDMIKAKIDLANGW